MGVRPWQIVVAVLGIAVLVVVSILKLGGGGHGPGMHAPTAEAGADPIDGAEAVTITATETDFEPEALELVAGVPVNLTLTNDGAVAHDWDLPEVDAHLARRTGRTGDPGARPRPSRNLRSHLHGARPRGFGMTMTVEVRPEDEAAPAGGMSTTTSRDRPPFRLHLTRPGRSLRHVNPVADVVPRAALARDA